MSRTHLLEDLLLCSSQVLNVVDGCKDCKDIFLAHCKLKTLILKSSTQWGEDEIEICKVWLLSTTHLARKHLCKRIGTFVQLGISFPFLKPF